MAFSLSFINDFKVKWIDGQSTLRLDACLDWLDACYAALFGRTYEKN